MAQNTTDHERYSWLVDSIVNDYTNVKPYSYTLQENAISSKGTVMLVTGYGKSAIAYSDIMFYIVKSFLNIIFSNGTLNDKFIFNISSPQLRLNQQFTHDLLYVVIETIHRLSSIKNISIDLDEIYNQIDLIINSTDNREIYKDYVSPSGKQKVSVFHLEKYDLKTDFINNDNKHILFITSCHKSLYKLCSRNIDKCRMFTYIDEGHLLSIRGNADNDDVSKVKALSKLVEKSEGFYVFSATPNQEITKLVNNYNGSNVQGLKPIYSKTPYEAIQEGKIVTPKFVLVRTNKNYITEKMVDHIFKLHCQRTPEIPYHKLLICCNSFTHIEVLSKLLNEYYNSKGKKVIIFATDSKNGQRCITTGKKYNDVNEFTKDIDKTEQDCIVLHIYQMTAGIDVSSFTCTVKFVSDITTKYTSITQTVGRCLRLGEFVKDGVAYKEDRSLSITDPVRISQRLKKFGDNYIITSDEYTDAEKDLRRYIQLYWGIGYGHITRYHYKDNTKQNDRIEKPTSNDTEESVEEISVKRVQWTLRDIICNNRERYLDMLELNNPEYTRARLDELLSMYLDMKTDDIYFSEFSGFSILNPECLTSLIKEYLQSTNNDFEIPEQEISDDYNIDTLKKYRVENEINEVLSTNIIVSSKKFRTENEINEVLKTGDFVYIGFTKNKLIKDEDGLLIQLQFINKEGNSFFKYNGEKYIVGHSKNSGYKTINQFGSTILKAGINIYCNLFVKTDVGLESIHELCKKHFTENN